MKKLTFISIAFICSIFFSQVNVSAGDSQYIASPKQTPQANSELPDTRPLILNDTLKEYIQYLKNNAVPIDTAIVPGVLEKSDPGFDSYVVYLAGENHGVDKSADIELYFAKYFNKTQGVRHLISEIGFCDAQLANLYLQTGDTRYIDKILQNLYGTFSYTQNNYNYFVEIYKYNQTLPEDQRLRFVGVDVQHQPNTGSFYLAQLLPDTQPPKELQTHVDALLKSEKSNLFDFDAFERLQMSLKTQKDIFQTYLGDKYENFLTAVANIQQGITYYNIKKEDPMIREPYIIDNFTSQFEKSKIEKCYGYFGLSHTELDSFQNEKPYNLAAYLQHSYNKTAGKTASISFMYHDSYYMDTTYKNTKGTLIPESDFTKLVSETTESSFTFYRLDKEGSIFMESGSTAPQQYIVLIQNSPPATAYKKQ